jgi:histidyl-tRNA synthetase
VGIGVERLLLTLESLGIGQPVPPLDAFLIAATEDAKAPVRQLASSLRDQGFKVLIDLDDKKLGAQFKSADRSGARVALVLGDDELAAGTISVKVLATGDQTSIPQADLAAYLAG